MKSRHTLQVEELEAKLLTIVALKPRIDCLNDLSWQLNDFNVPRSLALCEEAYALSRGTERNGASYEKGTAESLVVRAYHNMRQGNFDVALNQAMEAEELFNHLELSPWLTRIYGIIGIILNEYGSRAESLAYHEKRVTISQKLGELEEEGWAYHDLAIQSHDLTQAALEYFEKARKIFYEIEEGWGLAIIDYNLSINYLERDEVALAAECANRCLEICNSIGNERGIFLACLSVGRVHVAKGEYEDARQYFENAYGLAKELDDNYGYISSLIEIGNLHTLEKQFDKALSYLDQALAITNKKNMRGFDVSIYKYIASAYEAKQDFERALTYYKLHQTSYQEYFDQKSEQILQSLTARHQTESAKKEAEIAQLKYVELKQAVDERDRAEAAFIQAQKHESLGIMAGGVAHDFNNLLVGVMGQSSLAMHKMGDEHPAYSHIDKSLKSSRRLAELTRQMLAYAGIGQFEIHDVSLNNIIEQNLDLLHTIVPPHVALQINYADKLPLIPADATQVYQIIVNLVTNAIEAGERNAHSITLQTGVEIICETDPSVHTYYWRHTGQYDLVGNYVSLSVKDNGSGMTEETLEKLFDPFYSTKFTGRGLGLAAVFGIVCSHKGGIHVQSQLGVGTEFEIVFPANPSEGASPPDE